MRRRLTFSLALLLISSGVCGQTLARDRIKKTFDGIECEYSPGQEELARALAVRFARHNEEIATLQTAEKVRPAPIEPLSSAEMRANRAVYLGRIAALLALEKPTALQEDCYDAFLDNYEETMILFDAFRTGYRSLQIVKQVTVWERAELVQRLESREKISGLSYDPVTKAGTSTYGGNFAGEASARLAELEKDRQKLKTATSLNIETKEGVTNYRARFDLNRKDKKPAVLPSVSVGSSTPAGGVSQWFPVIIPAGMPPESPENLARKLWEDGEGSILKMLGGLSQAAELVPHFDPQIAFLVLHETTEIGIVDHYFHGRDRRWFCDGVANYGAWHVLRDLHGETVANRIHNLPAQLQEFADLREQADLRKWPAIENESAEQSHSRLEVARYTFAERAVALMDERGGKDVLPRLFTEIGQTKPNKVSIKTVEKAWQKLTGTKLDTILADALKPLPMPVKPAG